MLHWSVLRSQLANATKSGEPDEYVSRLRTDFRVSRLYGQLTELAALDPPPTPEQRVALIAAITGDVRAEVAA